MWMMKCVLMGVVVLGFTTARGGELIPVGLQKQLLADDYVIAEKQNVTHEVGQAKKYGIVLGPTSVTDCQSEKIHDGYPDWQTIRAPWSRRVWRQGNYPGHPASLVV